MLKNSPFPSISDKNIWQFLKKTLILHPIPLCVSTLRGIDAVVRAGKRVSSPRPIGYNDTTILLKIILKLYDYEKTTIFDNGGSSHAVRRLC